MLCLLTQPIVLGGYTYFVGCGLDRLLDGVGKVNQFQLVSLLQRRRLSRRGIRLWQTVECICRPTILPTNLLLLPWSLYIGIGLGFSVAKISQISFEIKININI